MVQRFVPHLVVLLVACLMVVGAAVVWLPRGTTDAAPAPPVGPALPHVKEVPARGPEEVDEGERLKRQEARDRLKTDVTSKERLLNLIMSRDEMPVDADTAAPEELDRDAPVEDR